MAERKNYGFIRYETRIRREFYHDITKESVGNYIRSLEHEKSELDNLSRTAENNLGVSKETIEQHQRAVEDELEIARFYLDYFKRMKEPNFNEWVLSKLEKDGYDPTEEWTRTNGKVRITIRIVPAHEGGKDSWGNPDGTQHSTRVSIAICNDNRILTFYEKGSKDYPNELSYTNLRKPESITEQIEAYKKEAEELFKKYAYHQYCRELRELEEYETLLHLR